MLTITRAAGDFTGATTSATGDSVNPGHPASSIVVGTAILISATAVDLNTHIEVGPPNDWSASIPAGILVPVFGGIAHVDLATYTAYYNAGLVAATVRLPVNLVDPSIDHPIGATFDARTGQITLDDVRASGGTGIVRIKGELVNTNDLGNIQVNARPRPRHGRQPDRCAARHPGRLRRAAPPTARPRPP